MAAALGAAVFCAGGLGEAVAVTPGAPVLEYRMEAFSEEAYRAGVERLLAEFEAERGEALRPGETGRVGLKIFTGSGLGLATPRELTRAVAGALEARGFERENIFLVDLNEVRLRRSGYLPPLSESGEGFEGQPVYVLESGRYYDAEWFYDSALPPRSAPRLGVFGSEVRGELSEADRRSLLAMPLLRDLDFWINLPVYTDHAVLGLNGALVNATLWNASNTFRFFQSGVNGPAAVAEMAAIPELAEKWAFTVASGERFQFIGGPGFHSLYTASAPVLLLSADPVAIDSEMLRRINERRQAAGFEAVGEYVPLLDYAEQLGLGSSEVRIMRLE